MLKTHAKTLILSAIFALCLFLCACGENAMFKVPSFKVTFYSGETVVATADVRSAALIKNSLIAVDAPSGYSFDGYFDEDGAEFDKQYKLKGDVDFYARFTPIRYSITYNIDGGATAENPTFYTVETPTFTLNAPSGQPSDMDFAGWTSADSSSPEKSVTIETGTTGDLTFTAVFEDNDKFYLYFETFGGTEITRLDNKTGVFALPSEAPEKSGYNFVNWYIDENRTVPLIGDTYVALSKSNTLYAKYSLIDYRATFLGCDLGEIVFNVETESFALPVPTKEGNTFDGFTYDALTTPIKDFVIQKGTHRDYVFTARFTVNNYTITFETFGGDAVDAITAPYGSDISAPVAPEKSGCEFLGWYTDELCAFQYNFTTMPAANFKLYAGWYSDENYKLSYSIASGFVSADVTASRASGSKVHAGDAVSISAPAFAHGGVFRYWKKRVSLVSEVVYSYDNELSFAMPSEDLELKAEYVQTSSFNYAKGSGDLTVSSEPLTRVFGNKIAEGDYTATAIKSTYLDAFADGDYLFELLSSEGAHPIIVRVSGGGDNISFVRLDYDVNYPSVTLVFDQKDGYEYEYSLNSSAFAPCQNGLVLPSFNKRRSGGNKITVRRVGDETDVFSLTKSAYNAINEQYYEKTFNFNGLTYDYVIESYDELLAMMGYFAAVYAPDAANRTPDIRYPGGKATIRYFVDPTFRTEFTANRSEYVHFVIVKGSMPYYPSYTDSFDSSTGVETVNYFFSTDAPNTQKSDQPIDKPSDEQKLLSFTSTRPYDYDNFKINAFTRTQSIRSLYELECLAFGVKPTFTTNEGQAYTTYEKAKSILREYVDDGMSDYQKVIAIYDYLSATVTYDHVIADMAGGNKVGFGQYSCFTSYGALVDEVAVCDGISSAFRLLCMIEGIEAEEYTGYSVANGNVGGHAWNKVKIGGNWYGVDATWCTVPVKSDGNSTTYVQHKYLIADEGVMYNGGHRERAEVDTHGNVTEYPVEYAAYGAFDYFSIPIYGTDNLTRTVRSRSEINKLVAYAKSVGATVIEFRNASPHSINELIVGSDVSGTAKVDDARGLYYAFIE